MAEIILYKTLNETLTKIREKSQSLIVVGGCFDILHPGHGHFLQKAKELGGSLFVLLESDETIRQKKGDNRPYQKQPDRAYILSLLIPVDYILPLPYLASDEQYHALVKLIKPDIIAITYGDPLTDTLKHQAQSVGARLEEVIHREHKYATSIIAKKL